jgi:alpha-L-rhamnosidase
MSTSLSVLAMTILLLANEAPPYFVAARPVWPEARETEMNLSVGFRATFNAVPGDAVVLKLTGSTLYRVYLNGDFLCHGPARAGHGYFRVDEVDISDRVNVGMNSIAIEVAGYNVNSYYLLDQPAFLQAEVLQGADVLCATGVEDKDFAARVVGERVQKVQRFSFQRPFVEVYRLNPAWDRWRKADPEPVETVTCAIQPDQPLLPRRVSYPTYMKRPAMTLVASGTMEPVEPQQLWKDRALVNIGPELKGYPVAELDIVPSIELQKIQSLQTELNGAVYEPSTALVLEADHYQILDLGTNLSGFIGSTVICDEVTRLYVTFDEILTDGDVDFKRLGCVNAVLFELEPGTYELETFEPYTARYLKFIALGGACTVSNVYLREYVNPDTWNAHFAASDDRLNRLFEAGRETYAQNAVDIFMDCPSRERAGWLCDSLFTARVAQDLSGGTAVEKNFLENYLKPEDFAHLPEGMLPMCYPSDHYDGVFIPNWAMWFVIQLEEYLARSGDREMVDALKPRVLALLKYFEPFRNQDGLLEKLESWVFVEWSEANKFVQDVNYPSNMLYAAVLRTAGRMYEMPDLIAEADRLRAVIHDQSFDGEFFVDNAVRTDGNLEITRNRSEVCQYFAFFFDVATPETHPELWERLCTQFGPDRKETKAFEEVHLANSFIGNMLRFEILSRYQKGDQILPESIGYLLYMAERTGTLWENVSEAASCNHGFASHIVHTLYRDMLGLYKVDSVNKAIAVRLFDIPLEWCEGRKPLPDGSVSMRWWKEGETMHYRIDAPAGYTITVENNSNGDLVREP